MYAARVLLDSITEYGDRLTTVEITIPKWIQAELNTHRQQSKNSASSRARPNSVIMQQIMADPVIPVRFQVNARGMQGGADLEGEDRRLAEHAWLDIRDAVIKSWGYHALEVLDVHKQLINRVLEPWLFTTVIVSATDWSGFFLQRCHEAAQPEFQHVAVMLRAAVENSSPSLLGCGAWHLPLMQPDESDMDPLIARRVSAARCARVSYLSHEGKRDVDADLDLFDRLVCRGSSVEPGHWSPLEHVAKASNPGCRSGNFRGWIQLRKLYPGEHPRDLGDRADIDRTDYVQERNRRFNQARTVKV